MLDGGRHLPARRVALTVLLIHIGRGIAGRGIELSVERLGDRVDRALQMRMRDDVVDVAAAAVHDASAVAQALFILSARHQMRLVPGPKNRLQLLQTPSGYRTLY